MWGERYRDLSLSKFIIIPWEDPHTGLLGLAIEVHNNAFPYLAIRAKKRGQRLAPGTAERGAIIPIAFRLPGLIYFRSCRLTAVL